MGCDHHGSCNVAYRGDMGCDQWKRRIFHQVIARKVVTKGVRNDGWLRACGVARGNIVI